MALKDIGDSLEGKGWLGIGIGAIVLAPMLVPAIARGLRPAAKGAIKGYLALSERTREMLAETGEQLQDLVAEAKAEYESREQGAEMMTMEPAEGEVAEEAAPEGEPRPEARPRSRPRRAQAKAEEEAPAEAA